MAGIKGWLAFAGRRPTFGRQLHAVEAASTVSRAALSRKTVVYAPKSSSARIASSRVKRYLAITCSIKGSGNRRSPVGGEGGLADRWGDDCGFGEEPPAPSGVCGSPSGFSDALVDIFALILPEHIWPQTARCLKVRTSFAQPSDRGVASPYGSATQRLWRGYHLPRTLARLGRDRNGGAGAVGGGQ